MRRVILLRHGQSELNAIQQHQAVFCGQWETRLTYPGRQQAPGGENLQEVTSRAWEALQEVKRKATADLLIVTHCQTIRCLIARMISLDSVQATRMKIPHAVPLILSETSLLTWKLTIDTGP